MGGGTWPSNTVDLLLHWTGKSSELLLKKRTRWCVAGEPCSCWEAEIIGGTRTEAYQLTVVLENNKNLRHQDLSNKQFISCHQLTISGSWPDRTKSLWWEILFDLKTPPHKTHRTSVLITDGSLHGWDQTRCCQAFLLAHC